MSTVIKAIFDSTDSADNALAYLKRGNMNVKAYRVSPIERGKDRDSYTPDVFPGLAAPMLANASVGGLTSSIAPLGVAYDSYINDDDRMLSDAHSDEVIINITVDDTQAEPAMAALISLGGRQVSRM